MGIKRKPLHFAIDEVQKLTHAVHPRQNLSNLNQDQSLSPRPDLALAREANPTPNLNLVAVTVAAHSATRPGKKTVTENATGTDDLAERRNTTISPPRKSIVLVLDLRRVLDDRLVVGIEIVITTGRKTGSDGIAREGTALAV